MRTTTLLDIHRAVGGNRVFAIGIGNPTPSCAVEQVVNRTVKFALQEAERALLDSLERVSLADLASDFDAICRGENWGCERI